MTCARRQAVQLVTRPRCARANQSRVRVMRRARPKAGWFLARGKTAPARLASGEAENGRTRPVPATDGGRGPRGVAQSPVRLLTCC
jgi:hypothetical protein